MSQYVKDLMPCKKRRAIRGE